MRFLLTLGALAALLAPAAAQERVQVVATLPDLADRAALADASG